MNNMIMKYFKVYYEDEEDLLKGIRQMKEKGLNINDVLTPFPVHGIEKAMGWRRSRLSRVAFIGGAIGAILAFGFQAWVFTKDYPLNFGGKPFFSVPSFIPLTFEVTVLFAAFSMVTAFFIVNKLGPGAEPVIHDERITDDRFLVIVKVDEDAPADKIKQIENALGDAGGKEITITSHKS